MINVDDQYIPTIHVKTMTNGDENVAVIESYNTYNDAKSYPTVDIVDEVDEEPISPQEAYYDIQYPETKTTMVLRTQNRGQAQIEDNDAKSYPTVDIVDEDDEEPISPQEAYYDIQYPETKTTRVLMTQNRGQAQFY